MSIANSFRPVCGDGGLPRGYTRLLALRFTQQQGFYTGVYVTDDLVLYADVQGEGYTTGYTAQSEMCVFSTRSNYGGAYDGNTYCAAQLSSTLLGVYSFKNSQRSTFAVPQEVINNRNQYMWSKSVFGYNGLKVNSNSEMTAGNLHVGFAKGSENRPLHALVYGLQIVKGSTILRDYIPALDPTGRACFWEARTHAPVYSAFSNFVPVADL